jgi:dipeptidyl aminopeptidase/acylaminoacyl peptidase
MLDRRSFMQAAIASLAQKQKPVIFWFYSTEQEGIKQCPVSEGFEVVSFDLPCHGSDRRTGEPSELNGWRYRLQRGENLFEQLFKQCSQRLDQLGGRAIVGGVSRGAFAALHLSINDHRFYAIAALSPVTDLRYLKEFEGYEADMPLNPNELAKRSLFVSIEAHDDRVSTASCLELVRSIQKIPNSDVTLFMQSGDNHTVTQDMKILAEHWIEERS